MAGLPAQADLSTDTSAGSIDLDTIGAPRRTSVLARTVTSITPAVRFESMVKEELFGSSQSAAHADAVATGGRQTLRDILQIDPKDRSQDNIEEIEHALTRWSRYGTDLPQTIRLELCQYMGFASYLPGDIVFKQGDTGEHFYIILSGAVDVLVCEDEDFSMEIQACKTVAHLLAGAAFGELALMQGHGRRRATCRCAVETELFVVDIKDFRRILQPLQQGSLRNKIAFLKEVPETEWLPISTLESLAVVLTEKVLPPKSVVYYQGNEVEDMYFVLKGNVKMIRELPMDRETRTLARQSSSVPIWLQENKPAIQKLPKSLKKHVRKALSPSARSAGSAGQALHITKHSAKPRQQQNGSMIKPRTSKYMGYIAPRTKPGASSYHDLSLEVIQSLAPERPGSRPASRPSNRPSSRPVSSAAAGPSTALATKSTGQGVPSPGAASSKLLMNPLNSEQMSGTGTNSKHTSRDKGHPKAGKSYAAFGSSAGFNAKKSSLAAASSAAEHHAVSSTAKAAIPAEVTVKQISAMTTNKKASAMPSSKAASATSAQAAQSKAGKADSRLSPQKTFRFEDMRSQDEEESQAPADPQLPVVSEMTLTRKIMQQLDFSGSLHDERHLLLEVDHLAKTEFFGDMCLKKHPVAPATAVTGNVATTLLVVSKWDLVKRSPKELVDHLLEHAQNAVIDDDAVREQYKQAKKWERYKSAMVKDILHRAKALKNNYPAYVWQGPFRPTDTLLDVSEKPWKPNGARGISIASPR